ncbi:hypothetical protein GCM10027614_04730 [Micromonospora vulcania]
MRVPIVTPTVLLGGAGLGTLVTLVTVLPDRSAWPVLSAC